MKRLSVMRLALGYAGMFFGAGFVSGQEIRQFFVVYGTAGLFGLVLSALLFFAVGVLFFETARQSPEQTVGELLVPGYHPLLSGAVDLAEDVLLFGVVVIMTAGAGAMVQQVTGWPAAAAGFVFVLVIFAASLKNMRSVMTVFSVLAPCLTVCAVAVAVFVLLRYGGGTGAAGTGTAAAAAVTAETAAEAAEASGSPLLRGPWSSAVLYAVYNLFGSFSIMLAMMPLLPDRKKTAAGMALGSLFLLIPAECVAASMLAVPGSGTMEVPTAYLAGLISPWFRNIYSVLMLSGMASAALGCLVGFLEQMKLWRGSAGFPYRRTSFAVCILAWALSLAGFGSLVGFIYPLFGYIGIPCVAYVLFKGFTLFRQRDNIQK